MENTLKKTIFIRTTASLVLAAALASCGGGTSMYTIKGVVYNLQPGTELILTTNGMEKVIKQEQPADAQGNVPAISYAFPNQLEYGEVYNVLPKQIGEDPATKTPIYQWPAHQTCSPTTTGRISDTAGRLTEIHADYACSLNSHSIGGFVTGLTTGSSVTLLNGTSGGEIKVDAPATPPESGKVTFTFSQAVTWNSTYGVTVKASDKVDCTVINGAGRMGDEPVADIEVRCVPKPS